MRSVVELTTTEAPRSARVRAAANPIPSALPAPVTSARLPASEIDTARDANQSRRAMLALKAMAVLGAVLILSVVARFVLGPEVKEYRARSQSMAPTVGTNETVMANFAAYRRRAPRLGDVVVVQAPLESASGTAECRKAPPAGQMCALPPGSLGDVRYIRRIVGVPGDRLSLEHGHVVRNGRALDEPYAHPCVDDYCDFPKPITVPSGSYFALGDNRGESYDSRFSGPLPRRAVLARVDDCTPVIRLSCHARR